MAAVPLVLSSTTAPLPQTLSSPAPPQVWGEAQLPQKATVRVAPQLSMAVTLPQFLPWRAQKELSGSIEQLALLLRTTASMATLVPPARASAVPVPSILRVWLTPG